jgi:hypothetical protein
MIVIPQPPARELEMPILLQPAWRGMSGATVGRDQGHRLEHAPCRWFLGYIEMWLVSAWKLKAVSLTQSKGALSTAIRSASF